MNFAVVLAALVVIAALVERGTAIMAWKRQRKEHRMITGEHDPRLPKSWREGRWP